MALLLHGKGIAVAAQAVAGAGGNIVRVELFSVDVNAKGDLAAYGDLAVDILLQPDGLAVLHVVHGIPKCLIVGTVNLSRWADLRLQSEGAEPVTGGILLFILLSKIAQLNRIRNGWRNEKRKEKNL